MLFITLKSQPGVRFVLGGHHSLVALVDPDCTINSLVIKMT